MVWWQIVIILIGSVVVGVGGGILLSRLINRFSRGQVIRKYGIASMFRKPERVAVATSIASKAAAGEEKEKPREKITMVPLLSRKCIAVVAIGLIVGVGLGLGYWAVSPVSIQSGWPPIELSGVVEQSPPVYESTVDVRIMSRGMSDTSLKTLQREGQYLEAKMNAFPFFQFLSGEIDEQAPQYSSSPEELAQMMRIQYDWNSDAPAIEIRTTSTNAGQAFYINSIVAEALQEHLIDEEYSIWLEEYNSALKEVESTRAALLEAEKELAILTVQQNTYDISLEPEYIELTAQIRGLESALDFQAGELAALVAEGNTSRDYIDILQAMERTSVALSNARSELDSLEAANLLEQATEENLQYRLEYTAASSKVEKLSGQLNNLTQSLASLVTENGWGLSKFTFQSTASPSVPTVVPPDRVRGRNALMMGAVFGMAGAWVVLNRKWLTNGMFLSSLTTPDKDKEDEE